MAQLFEFRAEFTHLTVQGLDRHQRDTLAVDHRDDGVAASEPERAGPILSVVYWGEADAPAEPPEVEFRGQRWPTQVREGFFWVAWWDEQDPDNLIPPPWPQVIGSTARPDPTVSLEHDPL